MQEPYEGKPVPAVNAVDFKSVWAIYQDIESGHRSGVGFDSMIEHACSPGADIDAVRHRCGLLWLLDWFCGDLLSTWKHNGQFQDSVFKVAARIPMNLMGEGLIHSIPPEMCDVDAFLEELRKDST